MSTAGGILAGLRRGEQMRADVIQVFAHNPRTFSTTQLAPEVIAEFKEAFASQDRVHAVYCHAPYLINLATENLELAGRSRALLVQNLRTASAIGSDGVIFHVGSHLGIGLERTIGPIASLLLAILEEVGDDFGADLAPLLLENTAGAGGTIGRSFAELGLLLAAAGDDPRLGVCLDTQHLFASGTAYETIEQADVVVAALDTEIGLDRLCCLHLNDSKVALGSNRDRHENLGEGTIGKRALGALISHDALRNLPAILEVPGSGNGPRDTDLRVARQIMKAGIARRKR